MKKSLSYLKKFLSYLIKIIKNEKVFIIFEKDYQK